MAESEDKDSKTEEPTEKKIRDSMDKGQVPFARDVPTFASFVAILVFMIFFAHSSAVELGGFLSTFIERPDAWALNTQHDAVLIYRHVFLEIAKVLVALMVLLILAGLIGSMSQNMPRMVLERIQPKFSRISLREGWKRMFGKKGWVEFAKSLGKLVFATAVVIFVMREVESQLLAGMMTPPEVFGDVIRELIIQVVVAIALVMLLIAAMDFLWSRYSWREDLRMSRQEVKDEMKQAEGDPIIRARLRSLQRDRARRRMMSEVPRATLVIANPTHYAIALRYVREENSAPVVVAKGLDLVALRIREIAEANDIPVFEEVALARSMYNQVSVDSVISPQFYQAVAELVRVIYARQGPAAAGGTVQ